MEDIKVGDFVRTKKGCICQILRTTYSKYLSRNKKFCYEVDRPINVNMELYDEDIKKHSPNIIELIEVGDIVEVFMEMDLDEEDTNIFEVVGITVDKDEIAIFNKDLEFDFVPVGNIRRILTQEQFKSVSYEV